MKRLTEQSRKILTNLMDYSPEERAKIDNIVGTAWKFFSNSGIFSEEEVAKLSTHEGISKQLDEFFLPYGLVFYFKIEGGEPILDKMVVELEREDKQHE